MPAADIQTSFAAGEISPQLYARVDLEKFQVGAALLRNFFVDYRGGVSNRPGTKYIATTKFPQGLQRLLPFIVSTDATYVLEFGEHYIRFYNLGVRLEVSPGVPYEVVTPYAAVDLQRLNYTQSADVLTLVHPSYPPANLSRLTDTTFSYAVLTTAPDVDPPTITTFVAPHSGPYSFGYLVTSVDLDGKEESIASNPGVKHSEGMNETTNRVIGLSWTPPSQAVSKYNVYKWGPIDSVTLNPATVWGFIGSSRTTTFTDNNIAPDFSKQPPGWGDPFSGGQFQSIIVNAPGSGYNGVSGDWAAGAIPYVPLVITGDGFGAAGYAVVDHALGTIIGVYLTNPGKGYTAATITANGQGGTGATFTFTFSDPEPLNPACTAYLQQRRWFAGSNLKPETLVASQIGLYNNFNTTPVSLATDALIISLASEQVNTVRAMVPVSYGMLVFTTGGSFLLSGGSPNAPITPSTVSVTAQASEGANFLRPLAINYDVLYGQAKGNRIRNLAFAWQRQSYTGSDVTSLAPHLFDGFHTTEWTWAEEPFKIVWAVRDDGTLLSLTYVPDQEVSAWCRHDTQGLFKSICSVPEGDTDAVYVIVQRHVPNETGDPCWVNYIERFAERLGCCIFDSWFLDCAVSLPLPTPPAPLYLVGDVNTISASVTGYSYDPCISPPTGTFNPVGNAYGMEALDNYNSALATEIFNNTFPFHCMTHQDNVGTLFDPVRRKIMYSAGIADSTGTLTNNTGFNLWDGGTLIGVGTDYDSRLAFNHWICELDIDTRAVTFYNCYSSANVVPIGIGGSDGTYRRFVGANWSVDNVPVLIDPRTGNVWQHTDGFTFSCTIYLFRRADNFSQIISPMPPLDADQHMELIGITDNWVYVRLEDGDASHYHIGISPREITAAETAADNLLIYANFDYPTLFNGYYFRECFTQGNKMYAFGAAKTGTRAYKLYKFTEPSAFVYPTPPSDGGFTDITPWAGGTGPNTNAAPYVQNNNADGNNKNLLMSLPLTGDLVCISKLFAQDITAITTDPLDLAFDCTYVNIIGGTFDYHSAFVTGYMTGAWVSTAIAADAAWSVQDCREVNVYLDQNSYAFDTDYTTRWLFFTVQPVVAGVWTPDAATNHQILVQYKFAYGAAPVVLQVITEGGWDAAYTAYATAISNSNVVNGSLGPLIGASYIADTLAYDETSQAFFGSGSVNNMYQLNPAYAFRSGYASRIHPPFLRLTSHGGTGTFVSPGSVVQVDCGKLLVDTVDGAGQVLTGTVIAPFDLSLPDDPGGEVEPILEGEWTAVTPTDTIAGLGHLNQKEVWALADGTVMGPYTVDAGSITLDAPASSVVVGLKYTQQIQTLYLTMEGLNQGTEQGKRKQISGITLRVDCTLGPLVGSDFDRMYTPPELDPTNGALFTGDSRAINFTKWDDKGEVCVQQDAPLPASINGIIVEVTPGDTGR